MTIPEMRKALSNWCDEHTSCEKCELNDGFECGRGVSFTSTDEDDNYEMDDEDIVNAYDEVFCPDLPVRIEKCRKFCESFQQCDECPVYPSTVCEEGFHNFTSLDAEEFEKLRYRNNPVDHPAHYTDGKIEVIDFIEDKQLNFHRGNAVKYISRAGKKDPAKEVEDLKKAVWYLNREIKSLEELNDENN